MPSPLQGLVRAERIAGVPGAQADDGFADVMSYANDDPRAQQIDTVTATGATNLHLYTVTINGVDCNYTSDAAATVAEIADGLAAAIEAEPLVNATVGAVSDGVSLVTITATTGGVGYTISEADAQLTLASVAANATAAAIPFGRCVIEDGLGAHGNKLCKLINAVDVANSADLTAQGLGVAGYDPTREIPEGALAAEYPGNSMVSVMHNCRVYAEIEAALTSPADPVFVRTAASGALDKIGGFAPAAGAGLVQWLEARWVRQAGSGLAVLEINL
jgi:hypothetical protein